MNTDQRRFLDLLLARDALRFGDFSLKSGRKSPYFINTGCFCHGGDLERLGNAYASLILDRLGQAPDLVFGPAYKGIPLALATAQALERLSGQPVGWTYDRKEAKDHGDGGSFVGMPLRAGAVVVVVDDVLTAGTALRETLDKLRPTGVRIACAVVSVDRQERGRGTGSARQELAAESGIAVHALLTMTEVVTALTADGRLAPDLAARVRAHLAQGAVQP